MAAEIDPEHRQPTIEDVAALMETSYPRDVVRWRNTVPSPGVIRLWLRDYFPGLSDEDTTDELVQSVRLGFGKATSPKPNYWSWVAAASAAIEAGRGRRATHREVTKLTGLPAKVVRGHRPKETTS